MDRTKDKSQSSRPGRSDTDGSSVRAAGSRYRPGRKRKLSASKSTGSRSNRYRNYEKILLAAMANMSRHPGNVESRHTHNNMGVLRIKDNHPTWCGPTAVAFLTGCTVNDAAQLYSNVRNRKIGESGKYRWMKKSSMSLSGVYPGETWEVLNLLGYDMEPIGKAKGVTVQTLADRRFSWQGNYCQNDKLLVMLPSHYVVAHRFLVSDNHVQHVPAKDHPYGEKRIDEAWRVFDKPYGGYFAMTA